MVPKSTTATTQGDNVDTNAKLLIEALVTTLKANDAKIDTSTLAVLFGFDDKNKKNV
jgi:hypothetical protein